MKCGPLLTLVLTVALAPAGPAFAVDLFPELQTSNTLPAGQEVRFRASFTAPNARREAVLQITAEIAPAWHVYSVTQRDGGPTRTVVRLKPSDAFVLLGPFKPDRLPRIHKIEFFDVPVEEHYDRVTWSAPIRLAEGVDPASLEIRGDLDGQVCGEDGVCIPFDNLNTAFAARLDASAASPPSQVPRPPRSHVAEPTPPHVAEPNAPGLDGTWGRFTTPGGSFTVWGRIEWQSAVPGGKARLVLTIVPEPDWHVYPQADHLQADAPASSGPRPTLIVWTDTPGLTAGGAVTSARPIEAPPLLAGQPPQRYYEGTVAWTADLAIPSDAKPGVYRVAGLFGFQSCTSKSCDRPIGVRFQGEFPIGPAATGGASPLAFVETSYSEVAGAASRQAATAHDAGDEGTAPASGKPIELSHLAMTVALGLLGGLILNLMPCVWPVVGLKILSFVEQGGQSKGRILALNLCYSLGLMAVFLILATLAAFLNVFWGEMFTFTWFKVAMTALVFVMALSFLGVWTIPIPGFVGSSKATELAAREGVAGAFFKGAFTTVLATPCSGPLLGPIFGSTLAQPPQVTFLLFGSIGLGMASPYLILGAFPALVRFLPKPGAWMETVEQVMAFLLLGTTVYLFYTMNRDFFIPTLALLVALWFACWLIGRVPVTAALPSRLGAWVGGTTVAALVGLFAFTTLVPGRATDPTGPTGATLRWQSFSPEALAHAQAEGKTVMLDFTANWCPTCKFNSATAIDTRRVAELVEKNGVVPMLADWTDRSDEIKQMLARLGSRSIPLLVIYPGDRPRDPIILRDLLVESQVLDALERAGPSRSAKP